LFEKPAPLISSRLKNFTQQSGAKTMKFLKTDAILFFLFLCLLKIAGLACKQAIFNKILSLF